MTATSVHTLTNTEFSSRRQRRKAGRSGFRDGRRRTLPDGGSTPSADLIREEAGAALSRLVLEIRQIQSALDVERATIEAELTAQGTRCTDTDAQLLGLATEPDLERLADRAVTGDPVLIKSLIIAKEKSDLRAKRRVATTARDNAVQQRDQLLIRQAEVVQRIERLDSAIVEQARNVAAQADLCIAHYSTALLRWHKDRKQLRPLLPLARLGDDLERLIAQNS